MKNIIFIFAIIFSIFSFGFLDKPKPKKIVITIDSVDDNEDKKEDKKLNNQENKKDVSKTEEQDDEEEVVEDDEEEEEKKISQEKSKEQKEDSKNKNLRNKKNKEENKDENVSKKDKKNKKKISEEKEESTEINKHNNADNKYEEDPDKYINIKVPYQENEDYIVSPLGLGTPVNFIPVQIDTTTYKTWVASSNIENNPSAFTYNKSESSTVKETGDWDSVIDEEGIISGNVLKDTIYLDKYKIINYKFIEAMEFEDEYKDYKYGKLGLGNCNYESDKEFCLLDKLKDNDNINKKIFSIREYNETHGELVIGSISEDIKENNEYTTLNLVNEDIYNDIEDEEFKMSWLTTISYVLFKNNLNVEDKYFDNRIRIENGLASFDSACHYIEAPYNYITDFENNFFEKIIPNVCRKVNRDGIYMFFCEIERFEEIIDKINDLSFVIVINGYGFNLKMGDLFEKINDEDYEFYIHFKNYEQNIWNLGHPFFHNYAIIFDQDNQEISVSGNDIYDLRDLTEKYFKKDISSNWWKILLIVLLVLLLLVGLFYLGRRYGIKTRLDTGVSPSLVDNESQDDFCFAPGQNVH